MVINDVEDFIDRSDGSIKTEVERVESITFGTFFKIRICDGDHNYNTTLSENEFNTLREQMDNPKIRKV